MNPLAEHQTAKRPGILSTSLALLGVLVLYPLAGALLTLLATGWRGIDPDFSLLDPAVMPRIRIAQAVGQLLALGIPALLLAWRHSGSRTPFDSLNLAWLGIGPRPGLRALATASAGMLLLQPLMYSITEVQNLGLPYLGEAGRAMLRDQARLEMFIRKIAASDSFVGFLGVAAVLVATPAFCEELFFRGYVQKSFSSRLSPAKGVVLTGFVFALFHLEPSNIVPLTLLGWYIGYIYQKSGSLAVPAIAHGTNNLLALLFLEAEPRLSGLSMTGEGQGLVSMWRWWAFVLASLALFFVLIRRFPEPAAALQSDINI
ncbi:MAG: CPBP family intramembrane metalloprotease [Chlorobiaceae bacterium]|nr:CPBP family intramembrane metalloprotease [Chlorobiaceae bacterium]